MNDNKFPAQEWWTDEQKAIVEDRSSVCEKRSFKTCLAIGSPSMVVNCSKFRKDENIREGAVLDNAAWDHEHCALCWQTISEHPTHQQDGVH